MENNLDLYFVNNYKHKTKQEMANELGVSYGKIEWELRKRKLTKYKSVKYTDDEIKFLKENYSKYGAKYCAEKLGRSFGAVCKKAEKLGLIIERKYKYISQQGYIICCEDRENRYELHRKIMEDYIGRKLNSNEIVHHKDGNKLNNDINNLEILTRSEHIKLHKEDLKRGRKVKQKI